MKISIIGFGRSGRSAARLAEALGYEVFVSERANISLPYPGETGGHTERILDGEIVVVSPGVPDFPLLEEARKMGKEVIDELEFAYRYMRGKVIAVTGTNGKTTTCGMIHEILKVAGTRCFLAGNIYPGVPLSEVALKTDTRTITVVEVSSFQLERISMFRPDVGIVMNISPDHMDRYNNFQEYAEAKKRLFMNHTGEDIAILNLDDPVLSSWDIPSQRLFFSRSKDADIYMNGDCARLKSGECVFKKDDIKLIGDFFVEDGMAAALGTISLGLNPEFVKKGLSRFKGIPHRMEIVKTNPIIVNNSMCTNPVAFRSSISSMKGALVFMGGRLKNLDPEELAKAAMENAGFVILFGESRNRLAEILEKHGYDKFYVAETLEDGVKKAKELGAESILFSPGGSSHDMFKNFAERGEAFKRLVKEYFNG